MVLSSHRTVLRWVEQVNFFLFLSHGKQLRDGGRREALDSAVLFLSASQGINNLHLNIS